MGRAYLTRKSASEPLMLSSGTQRKHTSTSDIRKLSYLFILKLDAFCSFDFKEENL